LFEKKYSEYADFGKLKGGNKMQGKVITMLNYVETQLLRDKKYSFIINEYFTFDLIDYYFKNISIIPYNRIIYRKIGNCLIIKLEK
jgi:hypothetical protein